MPDTNPFTALPKVPFLVKNGYGVIALCALLSFPLYYPLSLMYGSIFALFARLLGLSHVSEPPIFVVFITALMVAGFPPLFMSFSQASRYLIKVVKHYLDKNDPAGAEEVLLSRTNLLWYRDYRDNQWLQDFIRDRKVHEKSPKLMRFAEKGGSVRTSPTRAT